MKIKELLTPWLNLELGQRVNGQLCPFCHGGDHEDKSFSVSRKEDGNIVYICHRNKCNRSGVCTPDGTSIMKIHTKTREHKIFSDPTETLADQQYRFFEKVYGIKQDEIEKAGFLWVPERQAVWQPVKAPDGHFRGIVVRRYQDKAMWSYKDKDCPRDPLIAWFPGPMKFDANLVVIVEDMLSALKFSRWHTAVAINGIGLSPEAVVELMQWSKHQYLCLDADAITTALYQADRWKHLLDIKVRQVKRDPKYWQDHQLQAIDEDIPF